MNKSLQSEISSMFGNNEQIYLAEVKDLCGGITGNICNVNKSYPRKSMNH